MFDKDDADSNAGKTVRFLQAEKVVDQELFKLAYSNEVFELWLLLYLEDVAAEPPLPRQEVYRRLGAALQQHAVFSDFQYNHQQVAGETITRMVQEVGSEKLAIQRAEVQLTSHRGRPLLATNPSTRVHLLVQSIRKWITYFGYGL